MIVKAVMADHTENVKFRRGFLVCFSPCIPQRAVGRSHIAATPAVYNSSSSLLLRQLVLRTVCTPASPRYGPLLILENNYE